MHTAQQMPLSLIVSCFNKIQIGFTSLVPAHPGIVAGKGPLNARACFFPTYTVLSLVTAAAERNHFVVLFQDDVLVVVEVEQADGVQLARHAARSVHRRRGAHGVCSAAAANA